MRRPDRPCHTEGARSLLSLNRSKESTVMVTYNEKNQPGKDANPARGQLDREHEYFPVPVRALQFGLEMGSIVPSRVSLLISILRLSIVLTGLLTISAAASIYSFNLNRHTPPG